MPGNGGDAPTALSDTDEVVGILDTVDVPIMVVGRDCKLVRINRAATETFGVTASDIGRRLSTVHALADLPDVERLCAQAIADEAPIRRDVRSGDRRFLFRVAPCATRPGEVTGAVLTLTNVTAFRASLEQAVYEREYTKAILNTVPIPLVVLDSDLRVQSANRAFYSMFDVSRERTHYVPLQTLGDNDWKSSGLWASLNAILANGDDFVPLEVERDFPAMGRRTVLLDARRVSNVGDGTILLAIQDITERKRTEDRLRDADRRKDEFLALLAHELRNPLAPIRTGLELLRLAGDSPHAVRAERGMMERQVHHMVRLIDDLLDVSRITSGKIVLQRVPTSVTELVQSAIGAQRSAIDAEGIDLTVDLPDGTCVIDVDPVRFSQILSNVLQNASKFTPPHGKIRCTVETLPAGEVPQVSITVSDTGVGIPSEVLPHVFDLFVQAQAPTTRTHGGLGIGLALARQLVELHGGEIHARSDGPGCGATIVITMPLSEAAAVNRSTDHVDVPYIDADVPHIASRVVIIDDNRDAASAMSELVERYGGSTRVANDATTGLAVIRDFDPDMVFLDIGMPGMDGYEACRRIRQTPSQDHIVVVALTGWGQPHDKQRAVDAGFDLHLTKPVDPQAIARVLATVSHGP